MTQDTEESLEREFRDLFRRALAVGRREGERAALARIIGFAQAALSETPEEDADRAGSRAPERPTQAQGRSPLRLVH